MCVDWTFRREPTANDRPVGRFEAYYPEKDEADSAQELPKFIKLTAGTETACFSTGKIIGGSGCELVVHPDALPEITAPATVNVTYEKISSFRFRCHLIRKDQEKSWAFAGFVVAVFGFIISASFDIGEQCIKRNACSPWIVEPATVVISKIFSTVMQLAGLFLGFWKGFFSSK